MTEAEYWLRLEFRLCQEFRGLPQRRYRCFWCDGLIPYDYSFEDSAPRITGRTWIGNGAKLSEWQFVLHLFRSTRSRDAIDWDVLLPPENVTRWMSFDEERRCLEIDPGAAIPDPA